MTPDELLIGVVILLSTPGGKKQSIGTATAGFDHCARKPSRKRWPRGHYSILCSFRMPIAGHAFQVQSIDAREQIDH